MHSKLQWSKSSPQWRSPICWDKFSLCENSVVGKQKHIWNYLKSWVLHCWVGKILKLNLFCRCLSSFPAIQVTIWTDKHALGFPQPCFSKHLFSCNWAASGCCKPSCVFHWISLRNRLKKRLIFRYLAYSLSNLKGHPLKHLQTKCSKKI